MSDPVTNVEIEDVLSSIRRLVSDGGKARTRDPAPVRAEPETSPATPDMGARSSESKADEPKTDRFVLTPAFMVVENVIAAQAEPPSAGSEPDQDADDVSDDAYDEDDQDSDWEEELPDTLGATDDGQPDDGQPDDVIHQNDDNEPQPSDSDFEEEVADIAWADDHEDRLQGDDHNPETVQESKAEPEDAVIRATHSGEDELSFEDEEETPDLIWGSVDEARKVGLAAVPEQARKSDAPPSTDRSGLIASIAELEAAVSNSAKDFEPDGSEAVGEMLGETIAWPGTSKRNLEVVKESEDADQSDDREVDDADQSDVAQEIEFEHRKEPIEVSSSQTVEDYDVDSDDEPFDDDDIDGLLDAGNLALDEVALRALVSEIVREELTGPMGERITRNVRKLVRREIYRILSSQEFD